MEEREDTSLKKEYAIALKEKWSKILQPLAQNKTEKDFAKDLISIFDSLTERFARIYLINSKKYEELMVIFLSVLDDYPFFKERINLIDKDQPLLGMRIKDFLYKVANVENLPTSPKVSQKRQLLIESDIKRIKKKSKALAIILINLKRIQMGSVFTLAEN